MTQNILNHRKYWWMER